MTGKRYPLVAVTWVDPSGPTSDWTSVSELGGVLHTVVSVGYLTKAGDVHVIVPHLVADDDTGFGEISIPKGVIVEIETLVPAA